MTIRRRNNQDRTALDLTTCSDIIFTLLIFYILTQSFVVQMPAAMPELSSGKRETIEQRQIIEISAENLIRWNDEVFERSAKAEIIKRASTMKDFSFLLMVHSDASAGTAIDLLDALNSAGIKSVAFAGSHQQLPPSPGEAD